MKKQPEQTFSPDSTKLLQISEMNSAAVLDSYHTSLDGYGEDIAGELRMVFGCNELSHKKSAPAYRRLAGAFANPFTAVLGAIAAVSLLTDVIIPVPGKRDPSTVIIIAAMVIISGLLRFVQETRSNNAVEKLKALVHTTAAVARGKDGKREIPLEDIVPGDIVFLAAGDMIPADVRILNCKDLFISQSALTGESEPCEKFDRAEVRKGHDPLGCANLAFMGSTVVSGSAVCIVVATGNGTCFGSMTGSIAEKPVVTGFEKGVNSVSWVLIRFMLCMVPVVLFVNGFTKGDWVQAVLFALSVAVGLTPEMLPMIVTTGLAKGAVVMAKKKTIVKHLNVMQNFGSMDVFCTDKTGTITQDKIVLERYLDIHGNDDERILRFAFLNSYYQTGLKNLMDIAILNHAKSEPYRSLEKEYTKVDEIPFDFNRRRMTVVIRDGGGLTQMITKGAVEEMLDVCTFAEYNGQVVSLSDAVRREILQTVGTVSSSGMRVLAVARKTDLPAEGVYSVKDECGMVLIGYLAFLDPPKESASAALGALKTYGVAVKVLTGDNEAVTSCVCREVGLKADDLLLGSDIEHMSDGELSAAAERTTIFAKLSPRQKARIIRVLRGNGHTVGFMGDGINDAAAMHEADVAVSVDTAVDIAKESADIILLEKDLMVLERGVLEGRRTFGNIMKYIKMTASSNFGNMLSVLTASAFLPFLPMQPVQILFLNLVYDISCIMIPWDNLDNAYLQTPRRWNASSIIRFMVWLGPASSVFDILTYVLLYFVICPAAAGGMYGAAGTDNGLFVNLFNAGWFTESLWTQTLVVHMIRTTEIPFIKSCASRQLLFSTFAAILMGTVVPFTPVGRIMGMAPLPPVFYPVLVCIILGYMALATVVKTLYRKRYGELL